MTGVKSVAIIGAGPAGAIAVDALMQEKEFDVIRVFDRQERAGGCWYTWAWRQMHLSYADR
jgi:cation diffusion facilitator CzcD-associated flavoprotein CzcO